jgi:hypothetical protein
MVLGLEMLPPQFCNFSLASLSPSPLPLAFRRGSTTAVAGVEAEARAWLLPVAAVVVQAFD